MTDHERERTDHGKHDYTEADDDRLLMEGMAVERTTSGIGDIRDWW